MGEIIGGEIVKSFVLLVAAVFTVLITASPANAAYAMKFGKIQYDSPGKDTRSKSSLNAEWVRLWNTTGRSVSLTGWRLNDRAGHTYVFPHFILGPNRSVRIHTGRGTDTTTDRYWNSGNYIWNNDGDAAALRDGAGHVIDRCSWNGGGGSKNC